MGPITGGGSFGSIVAFFVLLSLFLFIVHIVICVWAYKDALSKGRSQEFALLILIGLFFFPVLGIIVYFLIRNENGSNSRY